MASPPKFFRVCVERRQTNHWDLRHVVVSQGFQGWAPTTLRERRGKSLYATHKTAEICASFPWSVRRRMPAISRNGQTLLLLLALCAAAVAAGNRFEEGRTAVVAAELEALGISSASIKVNRRLCVLLLAAAGNVRLGGPGS